MIIHFLMFYQRKVIAKDPLIFGRHNFINKIPIIPLIIISYSSYFLRCSYSVSFHNFELFPSKFGCVNLFYWKTNKTWKYYRMQHTFNEDSRILLKFVTNNKDADTTSNNFCHNTASQTSWKKRKWTILLMGVAEWLCTKYWPRLNGIHLWYVESIFLHV